MSSPISRKRSFKFRVLRHIPGSIGRRYDDKFQGSQKFLAAEAMFNNAMTQAGDKLCLDLGANVGEITNWMAKHAAKVMAFEPDPWTAAHLRKQTKHLDNVEVIEAAVGTESGKSPWFRQRGFDEDPFAKSIASSILQHEHVTRDSGQIEVRTIDFAEFLAGLSERPWVIKMDIEGAEVDVMEKLVSSNALDGVGYVFVETHERYFQGHPERVDALRARTSGMTSPEINWDWW